MMGPWGEGYPCASCGTPYPELQRDHIIARMDGGTDHPSNIQWLCPNCHHLKSQAERRRSGSYIAERMAAMSPEARARWRTNHEASMSRRVMPVMTEERRALLAEQSRGNTYQRDGARRHIETATVCVLCGAAFTYQRGLGQPRKRCDDCKGR